MMFFYHFGNIVHKTGETDNIAGGRLFQIPAPAWFVDCAQSGKNRIGVFALNLFRRPNKLINPFFFQKSADKEEFYGFFFIGNIRLGIRILPQIQTDSAQNMDVFYFDAVLMQQLVFVVGV